MKIDFNILKEQKAIAWDFDKTILGSPNEIAFIRYILAHPEQNHHIITFRRNRDGVERMLPILGFPDNTFKDIAVLPDALSARVSPGGDDYRFLETTPEFFDAYYGYKAEATKERGASILIDDMADVLEPYFKKKGVVVWNSFWSITGSIT